MKRNLQIAFVLVGFALMIGIAKQDTIPISAEIIHTIENVETPNADNIRKSELLQEVPRIRMASYVNLTFEEMELLESIAMAEAEGEDVSGKALVMRVVLNRCQRDSMSVSEVIHSPNQFAVGRMGIKPSEDCHEALNMVIEGWDESQGACYFNAGHYSEYGEPLFRHGGHYFSK